MKRAIIVIGNIQICYIAQHYYLVEFSFIKEKLSEAISCNSSSTVVRIWVFRMEFLGSNDDRKLYTFFMRLFTHGDCSIRAF